MPKHRNLRIPFLGKIALFWCSQCNIPLISSEECDTCHCRGISVPISPPGDIRPAFLADYELIWKTISHQYGDNVGQLICPIESIIILNRIGGLDRTDEIIIDGHIIGLLLFNPVNNKFEFQPRLLGGLYILRAQEKLQITWKRWIEISADALPYIFGGKSILAPGVLTISEGIENGDYCLILYRYNSQWINVSIGIARGCSNEFREMVQNNHGQLLKNKDSIQSIDHIKLVDSEITARIQLNFKTLEHFDMLKSQTPQNMVFIHRAKFLYTYNCNKTVIGKEIERALIFIRTTIKQMQLPIAVAYSGGKDSLCVLLLVWLAIGPEFKIFFANTGLELPEVIENIQAVAQKLNMVDKLIIRDAGETFWTLVESFGPPGRDFRFCCHSLKAQQITDIINTIYDGREVLVFLGQRRYESINRSKSPLIYKNSFIPLQWAATPIKSWSALQLWLFILCYPIFHPSSHESLRIPITPLYFQGHERIGCYLCPASNLSTLNLLKESHPLLYNRWFSFLEKYAVKFHLPREWIDLGLWRYKYLTSQWRQLLKTLGLHIQYYMPDQTQQLSFTLTKGFSPCLQGGYSIKGRFSQPLPLEKIISFVPPLNTQVEYDEELSVIVLQDLSSYSDYKLNLFSDGSLFYLIRTKSFDYKPFLKNLIISVYRGLFCNQCKTCLSICKMKAISILEDSIVIDPTLCNFCGQCLSHCPMNTIAKQTLLALENDDQK